MTQLNSEFSLAQFVTNVVALCLLLVMSMSQSAGAQSFKVIDLGTLGGAASDAQGINNSGQIVGYSETVAGDTHAFLYSGGAMTDLGTLSGGPGSASFAQGINDSGQIVGWSFIPGPTTGSGYRHAFLYSGGVLSDLGTVGSYTESFGMGINDAGQVTGYLQADSGVVHPYQQAFIYDAGVMQPLGTLNKFNSSSGLAINNYGDITGYSGHAYLYAGGVMTDLGTLGGQSSQGDAINNNGQVTGWSLLTGNSTRDAFLYSGGSMTDLGTLGGSFSIGLGINDTGEVVGDSIIAGDAAQHAFLYSGGVMTDVNPAGWSTSYATAINDRGQIVGFGTDPQGYQHAFLLTPVPEPATWTLLCSGLTAMAFFAGKRKVLRRV